MTNIPSKFYCSATDRPFRDCVECSRPLLTGAPYMIQKSYRRYPDYGVEDVVFEFAICMDCFEKMRDRMSRDSLQNMDTFFSEYARIEEHMAMKYFSHRFELKPYIEKCIIEGTPIANEEEYQIIALCEGLHLCTSLPPYAVSGKAMEKMSNLLSPESLGEMDDFRGRHLSGPPELRKLLYKELVLV